MLSTQAYQLLLKASVALAALWLISRTIRSTLQPPTIGAPLSLARPVVAKVSVLYGEENENYERAIASHERHALRHNYPFYVLRRPVAEGYWNKELYLLSILIQELGKPTSERVDWLMYVPAPKCVVDPPLTLLIYRWFDADSIIINPQIAVESFLPPNDVGEYHVLATKDQNGLNTGIFFLRVHQWSVNMLLRAIATPMFRPDIDLGFSVDQTAMALLFNETDNKDHILYQPRTWYNTYEFHHAYEGKEGDLLVHFPGLFDDRAQHMRDWLEVVEGPGGNKWQMPFRKTAYPGRIEEFWKLIRMGRLRIDDAPSLLRGIVATTEAEEAILHLQNVMHDETDQIATMQAAIETFDQVFGKNNIAAPEHGQRDPGEEEVANEPQ